MTHSVRIGSRLGRIDCATSDGAAIGTQCDDATEIGIVRRLSTSTETKGAVSRYRRPSILRAGRSVFVGVKLSVDPG